MFHTLFTGTARSLKLSMMSFHSISPTVVASGITFERPDNFVPSGSLEGFVTIRISCSYKHKFIWVESQCKCVASSEGATVTHGRVFWERLDRFTHNLHVAHHPNSCDCIAAWTGDICLVVNTCSEGNPVPLDYVGYHFDLDRDALGQIGSDFRFLFVQLKHCKIPTNISQTDIFLEFRGFTKKMNLRWKPQICNNFL